MHRLVVFALCCVVCAARSEADDSSADSLLAQIHAAEASGASLSNIDSLKDRLSTDISSVQLMDASDTLSLNEQLRAAQRSLNDTRRHLSEAKSTVANLTARQATWRSRCEVSSASLDRANALVAAVQSEVQAQDAIEAREQELFNASVSAIDRDLVVLANIESKSNEAVQKAADSASISPDPLLHQVKSLVSTLRDELQTSKQNAEIEWHLTSQRLTLESQPLRSRLASANNNATAALSDLESCQRSLNETDKALEQAQQNVVQLEQEEAKQQQHIQEMPLEFEKRHNARLKRISFMTDMLNQMEEIQRSQTTAPAPAV